MAVNRHGIRVLDFEGSKYQMVYSNPVVITPLYSDAEQAEMIERARLEAARQADEWAIQDLENRRAKEAAEVERAFVAAEYMAVQNERLAAQEALAEQERVDALRAKYARPERKGKVVKVKKNNGGWTRLM